MIAAPGITDPPVALTAHPLQRAGAFALAALADKRDPGERAEAGMKEAKDKMPR